MPMMVMQNKIPNNKWVRAIQKPPHISQIIFIMVDKHPVLDDVSVIFTPKGARPTTANLKHWMPKGIPTIVKQRIKPPIIYSKKIKIPPKIIQIILPKKFIVFLNLRSLSVVIVTDWKMISFLEDWISLTYSHTQKETNYEQISDFGYNCGLLCNGRC